MERIPCTDSMLKSASCSSSADIIMASRMGSAPNSRMALRKGIMFPMLFDILEPSISTEPFTTMPRGHISCENIATWFSTKNVRWFGTRSRPECL